MVIAIKRSTEMPKKNGRGRRRPEAGERLLAGVEDDRVWRTVVRAAGLWWRKLRGHCAGP